MSNDMLHLPRRPKGGCEKPEWRPGQVPAIYTVCVLRLGGRYPALQINAMATTAAPTTTGGVILAIKLGKFKSVAYGEAFRHPGIQIRMISSVGPTAQHTRSRSPEAI